MTKQQFIDKAVRSAEYTAGIPRGWWGRWRNATNGTLRINLGGGHWRLTCAGVLISRHDSRAGAFRKAAKLASRRWRIR